MTKSKDWPRIGIGWRPTRCQGNQNNIIMGQGRHTNCKTATVGDTISKNAKQQEIRGQDPFPKKCLQNTGSKITSWEQYGKVLK